MPEWTIDALTDADHGALFDLALLSLPHDAFEQSELIAKITAAPDRDRRLELAVRRGGTLIGVAVASGSGAEEPPTAYLKWLAVDPAHRRQGIGRALLGALEERCRASGYRRLTTAGHPPVYLWPGADTRYTGLITLLLTAGYRKEGEAVNLTVDLRRRAFHADESVAALARAGIAVRRLAAADRDRFDAYLAARWSANWRFEGLAAFHKEPPTGFIAEHGDRIVGFAVYDTARRGWFGPMGTDPDMRQRGVGRIFWQLGRTL